jgi:hypothetical protein
MPDSNFVKDSQIVVPVKVNQLIEDVGAVTIKITYDQSILEFIDVRNSVFPDPSYSSDKGKFNFAWVDFTLSGENVSGKIFDLIFDYSEGSTDLIFTNECEIADINGNIINIDFVNGNVSEKVVQSVETETSLQPFEFALKQNYPNPFNPSTNIKFTVKESGTAKLKVFNSLGEKITTLFNGQADPGIVYNIVFEGANLPSGIYIYTLRQKGNLTSKKMILAK